MSDDHANVSIGNDDLSLPKGTSPSIAGTNLHSLTLFIATVQKIVSEILPAQQGVAFAKEARDLLIECCVEFITLISSEANEISEKEAKKTIACDHITKALEQLGFSDYVPMVLDAAAEHKETQKVSYLHHSANSGVQITDPNCRDARRRQTSSPTAECLWRSLRDFRRSSLRRHVHDTIDWGGMIDLWAAEARRDDSPAFMRYIEGKPCGFKVD
ncbi:histone-fold-containing protein [Sarocladium strictum]